MLRLLLRSCLLLCALASLIVAHYLYVGTARPGIASVPAVRCAGAAECKVSTWDLGAGRWRVTVNGHGGAPVSVTLRPDDSAVRPGVVLVRRGFDRNGGPSVATVAFSLNGARTVSPPPLPLGVSPRQVFALPDQQAGAAVPLTVQATNAADAGKPLILDEIGLFRQAGDINRLLGLVPITVQDGARFTTALRGLVAAIVLISLLLALVGGPGAGAWAAFGCALAVGTSAFVLLGQTNGPEWSNDIRLWIAAGTFVSGPGGNLNYGMYMAESILRGLGPVIAGSPPWNRMPGYGYFLALGAGTDLQHIGLRALFLQIAVLVAGLGALVYTLGRLIGPLPATLAGALLAVAPAIPWYPSIEAMMPGVAFLVLAAGAYVLLAEEGRGPPRLRAHLLLHAAFAFWFALRPDVVPGWAIVSLLLYLPSRRRWPMLLVPVAFFLAIGLSWALFKYPFTHAFSLTTESFGASLMVGQWEMPHPFVWTVNDDAYLIWAGDHGFKPATKAASDWAVREVFRFWLTYPGYLAALVWFKFMYFIFVQYSLGMSVFPGLRFEGPFTLVCLTLMLMALMVWHRPLRLLLLGWMTFFNAPLFFTVFASGGRFYMPAAASFIVTATAYVFDRSFYTAILRRPWGAGFSIAAGLLVWSFGMPLAQWMANSDAFRFSLVLAAPAQSSLVKLRRPLFPELPGQRVDTAALVAASGAETVAGSPATVRAAAGVKGPVASLDLSPALAGHANCRLRVELSLGKGAVAVNVLSGDGRPLLKAAPIARAVGWFDRGVAVDFSVPLANASAGQPIRLSFDAASQAPLDMTLRQVIVHDCT